MSLHAEYDYVGYNEYAELHFSSIKSYNSWSDIRTLWGLMKGPTWIKTCSTGVEVHDVQREMCKILDTTQSTQCILLNAIWCEQESTIT